MTLKYKGRTVRTGEEKARRVVRKMALNPHRQVMFGVEAESDGHGGAVLTLVDINERRNLYHKYGQHNVRVSMEDMIGLGFPRRALPVLQQGYPVRVGMPLDVYEGLLTSGGFSGLEVYEGVEEDDNGITVEPESLWYNYANEVVEAWNVGEYFLVRDIHPEAGQRINRQSAAGRFSILVVFGWRKGRPQSYVILRLDKNGRATRTGSSP